MSSFFPDFHRCILQDRDLYELQHMPALRRPGLWNSEDEILKQQISSDINMSKKYRVLQKEQPSNLNSSEDS